MTIKLYPVEWESDEVLEVPLSDPRLHWTQHGATLYADPTTTNSRRYASGIDVCEWAVLQLPELRTATHPTV